MKKRKKKCLLLVHRIRISFQVNCKIRIRTEANAELNELNTIQVIRSFRVGTGTRTHTNKMMLANLRSLGRILYAQLFLLLYNF
jgi:hypothetical protein